MIKKKFYQSFLESLDFEPASLRAPDSWAGHLHFASWLTRTIKPKVFVELGVHTGNSYFSVCQTVQEFKLPTKCFGVDAWGGDKHAGVYGDEIYNEVVKENKKYESFSSLKRMFFDEALDLFPDNSIDFIHFDGLHTYEAISQDFEIWLPKLKSGSIAIFHDISVKKNNFGVGKFWGEVKEKYKNHFEFEHSNGLGVLLIDKSETNNELNDLFIYAKEITDFFSKIGSMKYQLANLDLRKIPDLEQKIIGLKEVLFSFDEIVKNKDTHIRNLESTVTKYQNGKIISFIFYLKIFIKKKLLAFVNIFFKAKFSTLQDFKNKFIFSRKLTKDDNYYRWIEKEENCSIKNIIEKYDVDIIINPLVSIVLPVYKPNLVYLENAILSVINQSYKNWQLCIADDFSQDQSVRDLLEKYSNKDERINIVYRGMNGHISLASNSAIEIAKGDWVTFLDHDDELSNNALLEVVKAINSNNKLKLIYSDEDKLDEESNRHSPHFKPDWNYDLLLSQNYICHLCAYDKSLFDAVGGFRIGYEGSQDYDLLLRATKFLKPSEVFHIPKILYHWRAHDGSTALDVGQKDYATQAGIKALQDLLKNYKVVVSKGYAPTTYRVSYTIPEPHPYVSLVIPTKDKVDVLSACVESILKKTTYINYEILIVDNGSEEAETLKFLAEIRSDPRVKVIDFGATSEFNYSAINNYAVRESKGSLIGLVNNDIEVINPDWMNELVAQASRPDIGCVGAKLYYPNNSIQHAGVVLGLGGVAGHPFKYFDGNSDGYFGRAKIVQNYSAVTGACLFVKKELFNKVGGLDQVNLKVAFNDVDLCLKIRELGYRNLWTPYANLVHHESLSRGTDSDGDKLLRFRREVNYMKKKWGWAIESDPNYNINLTRKREDFSIGVD